MLEKRLIMLSGITIGKIGKAISPSPHSFPAANVMKIAAAINIPIQHPLENVRMSATNIIAEIPAYTIFAAARFDVHIRPIAAGKTKRMYSPNTFGLPKVEYIRIF